MTRVAALTETLARTLRALEQNVNGVGNEAALREWVPECNHFNWLVGHLEGVLG